MLYEKVDGIYVVWGATVDREDPIAAGKPKKKETKLIFKKNTRRRRESQIIYRDSDGNYDIPKSPSEL